ncbi:Peptidase family M23 [Psychroflexus halocasei]|uniref:Peptidase family M23 n=1 Tax=Psychroflexus halocasei TaxID=908615 RepID=A0A1H3W099_9FLAO|nr:Peptidase family M23 [Psychroflexus halocasei]
MQKNKLLKTAKYFFLFGTLLLFAAGCQNDKKTASKKVKEEKPTKVIEKKPLIGYGLNLDDFSIERDTVRSGETFGSIMDEKGVSPAKVYQVTQHISDSIINFRRINKGKPYIILKNKDTTETSRYFIYEKDRINYAVIDLGDSIKGRLGKKPVTIKRKTTSGVIKTSLSQAISDAELNYILASRFSEIYQWSVDFFRLQKGDQFKLVYKEKFINDTVYAGLQEVEAAILKHKGREFYAFNFEIDSLTGRKDYFDEKAKTLRSFFLKAPLEYSRISSRYTRRRFHPVQKRWKAHKGTDYAAPTGTPIWSTADGVVTISGYTRGNGKYVKVRHTNKYTTQYLHMSRRAVKKGDYVKQGDIIGYVGSTGLATGPHVCYRFWVDGRQVDPYKQDLPDAEPMKEKIKPSYYDFIEPLKTKLDKIKYIQI